MIARRRRDDARVQGSVKTRSRPSPTIERPALDAALGCRAHLKCENLNPTGAFKVRGGVNLLSSLDDEQMARGVLSASTGKELLRCPPRNGDLALA